MGGSVERVIDVAAAVTLGVLTAPILAVCAVAVRLLMGSPVLYRQTRIGLGGKPFALLKLRTMHDDGADDDARLTPLGRWLRATSIDELPQLWNVLRGDMALVGPRPLLPQYLARYTPEQARRHAVKPGLTGLAQVTGRNALSWEEKFALDVWYVDHRSVGLDVRILARTVVEVLRGRGISAAGHGTMPEFLGSASEDGR